MLRITMNKSAEGAKKYFSEEYYYEGVNNQLDYYSEKNQLIGIWGGKAAEKLGLEGDIRKDDFSNLCDNINPETGSQLTSRNDKDRRVGYDFTFNASKSVSLAYTFGSDKDKKDILDTFRQSVTDTMNEIETGMQARVRSKGQNDNRETGNIAYGEFIHFTTRPIDGLPDPHLHAHCFVFNATCDEQDNMWKAGQFGQIKQDAPYYEAYFHSRLANNLEKLGYAIERTKNGFEIAGIDKDTLEKYSRRTKEIEEYAKDNNITDDKQKSQIGAKTREAKRTNVTAEQEYAEWKGRLTDSEQLQIKSLKTSLGNSNDNSRPEAAKDAIEYSLSHHLERKSVASDKEILGMAIKSSIGETTPEEVKREFNSSNEIITVKDKLRSFVTTRTALTEEKNLINNANSFKGKFRPINESYELKNESLNDQQKKAVSHALSTSDGITIIAGKAGTGKTTLMSEVKQGILESDKQIFAYAPSSEASRVVQRSEGFENADTLASLIQNKTMHPQLKNQVIWIDEAGMVSNRDMNKVLEIAKEQNARVILSGDVRQHNSVERGDALRIMQKYSGIQSVTVDKIQRQKNSDYRQAVQFLSDAKMEKGFKKLESIGAIQEIADNQERIKAVASDYYDSATRNKKKNVLVIAPTHAEGELVTNEIRQRLKDGGQLAVNERQFTVLKNLQYTEAQKQKPENYQPGQILAFHQNIKGVKAGSKLQVSQAADNYIIAKDQGGNEFNIPFSKAKHFNVFEEKKISISSGDKIRITGNGKGIDGKHLFNGTCYNISGFDRQGNIKLNNGTTLPADYGHFNYGYVMTSHASQGKTTDKIIISQSSLSGKASSMEQFYVSVSRGKQAVSIYTDDKAELMQAVNYSVQRTSATELVAKNDNIKATIEQSRLGIFKKMKDKSKETFDKLKSSNNKAHELPGTDREA